jgi:hypothetical protein
MTPGIGHILFAIKDGKRLPVRFHSTKLEPVILEKDVLLFRIRPTFEPTEIEEEDSFYNWKQPTLQQMRAVNSPSLEEIKFGDKPLLLHGDVQCYPALGETWEHC